MTACVHGVQIYVGRQLAVWRGLHLCAQCGMLLLLSNKSGVTGIC